MPRRCNGSTPNIFTRNIFTPISSLELLGQYKVFGARARAHTTASILIVHTQSMEEFALSHRKYRVDKALSSCEIGKFVYFEYFGYFRWARIRCTFFMCSVVHAALSPVAGLLLAALEPNRSAYSLLCGADTFGKLESG